VAAVLSVGIVSDTHCERLDGSDLPTAVLRALDGTDLIVHAGDLMRLGVLDQLESVAPVVAVRSRHDPRQEHASLHDAPHRLELDGVTIGLLSRPCDLPGLEGVGDDAHTDIAELAPHIPRLFGGEVSLVVYRGSHRDQLHHSGGTLYFDPGSPTWWAGPRATVARLTVRDGAFELAVLDITRRLAPRHRLARLRGEMRQWWWDRRESGRLPFSFGRA
jgi:hypothetical protein